MLGVSRRPSTNPSRCQNSRQWQARANWAVSETDGEVPQSSLGCLTWAQCLNAFRADDVAPAAEVVIALVPPLVSTDVGAVPERIIDGGDAVTQ